LALFLAAGTALAVPGAKQQRYSHGFEAGGVYRHVAGSACCHPEADPRPVHGPGSCERRCAGRELCDAFVFSPSTQLCFLIRYLDRAPNGQALAPVPGQVATDRVFGIVDREPDGGAFGGPNRNGRSARREQEEGGQQEEEDEEWCSADSEHVEFIIDTDCFSGEEECDLGNSTEWDEFLRQSFGRSDAPGEWSTLFEADCGCAQGASEWEVRFQEARRRVWPNQGACLSECATECAKDLQDTRRQMLKAVRKLMARLLGEDAAARARVIDLSVDKEDLGFCRKTCRHICDDLDDPGMRVWNGTQDGALRCWAGPRDLGLGGVGHAAGNVAGPAVQQFRDLLGVALDRAGARIREASPWLMDSAVFGKSDLLGSSGTTTEELLPLEQLLMLTDVPSHSKQGSLDAPLSLGSGFTAEGSPSDDMAGFLSDGEVQLDLAALLDESFGGVTEHEGLPLTVMKESLLDGGSSPVVAGRSGSADLLGALLGSGGMAEQYPSDFTAQVGGGTSAMMLNPALPAHTHGDSREESFWYASPAGLSTKLSPSHAPLFRGIPEAARWADGSPPFLQRLLARATARLGPLAQAASQAMR